MKLIRVTHATAVSLLLTAALAACGGSGDEGTATDAGPVQAAPEGRTGAGRPPGAFGTVAAVSGRTAQVQNDVTGQIAVSWTAQTTFTKEVDATLDDVAVGSCVVTTSDAEPGATEVTATSVRVLDGCDAPGALPSDLPTDLPTEMPDDLPSDLTRRGFGVVGEVSAISDDGFTVTAMDGEVAVAVTGDTTYRTTAEATDAAVRTGACVSAQGETDETGALSATSISVSEPVDGECTGGFGGGLMIGPGGPA